MNYKLKDSRVIPPTGFIYTQPETGAKLDGQSLYETIQLVMQHRITNELPRQSEPEVAMDVENQICRQLGHEWCVNMNAVKWGFRLDWDSIKAGTKTLFAWAMSSAKGESPYVPQDEAERRAAICRKCFANKRSGECISCGLGNLIRGLIGETCSDKTSSHDAFIDSCLVCSCLLRCKVHIKPEILATGISEKQKQAYSEIPLCWMNGIDIKQQEIIK